MHVRLVYKTSSVHAKIQLNLYACCITRDD